MRAPVSPRDFTAGSAAGKARALPAERMSPPVFGRFPLLGKLKPGVFAAGCLRANPGRGPRPARSCAGAGRLRLGIDGEAIQHPFPSVRGAPVRSPAGRRRARPVPVRAGRLAFRQTKRNLPRCGAGSFVFLCRRCVTPAARRLRTALPRGWGGRGWFRRVRRRCSPSEARGRPPRSDPKRGPRRCARRGVCPCLPRPRS